MIEVEETIDYDKWYCGHYHNEKQIDKLEFMFGRIKIFNKDEYSQNIIKVDMK